MRLVGITCLVAVVLGPLVWFGDLLGFTLNWLPVRSAFWLMLVGLLLAKGVAMAHISTSRLTRRERWRRLNHLLLPVPLFGAFEYLIGGRSLKP